MYMHTTIGHSLKLHEQISGRLEAAQASIIQIYDRKMKDSDIQSNDYMLKDENRTDSLSPLFNGL